MAITVNSHEYTVFGNKAVVIADIGMDSSYANGGETLDYETTFGLHDVDIAVLEGKSGCSLEYDLTNKKIKAYAQAPPIVYEEIQTPSSDVVTTSYPAAFFINVSRSGNNKKFRSTGIAVASLSDDEVSLVEQMAAGELTHLTVKDYDRLVGDGAFTGGTTNWTFNATPWTYGTNNLEKDGAGTNALTHDNFAAVIGRTYRLSLTLALQGANPDVVGTITPTLGGTAGAASTDTAGTYTWEITATTTDGLSLAPSNTSRFVIDDITIYDLSEPVYLTYVTQAWKDVWDNLVQDETKTLATGANTLDSGNKILACMYIDQTTATAAALTMIDEDDTVATGEVDLKLNSATAQFTVHSGQNAKAIKTTYVKVPDSGFIKDRLITNETTTKVGAGPYLNTTTYPILLWGYTGQLPVNGQTTQRMIDYAGTPGAGEFNIDFFSENRGTPTTPSAAGASHNHVFTGTAEPPALVVEEAVTVTTNVGTLAHVPLYIVAVQSTAGSTTGAFSVIPTGETPLTKQVAVTFTTGVMTFLNTDAVTAAKVTYIPKRGSGYLSTVTVDESRTASASKVNLVARAGLVQYVWDDTDGVLANFEQPGTAPSATHFCTVDILDTADTSIDSHADDAGNTLKVTYVPFTQIPPGCFVDDTDITLSSEAWNFTGDPGVAGYNNLVVPGFGVNVIGETGAAARAAAIWEGPTGTAGALVATWNPARNYLLTNNDTAITILSMPWMVLDLSQLKPTTPAGSNAAEATHTHAISYTASYGSILNINSNYTGTAAYVWGTVDEIQNLQPLEARTGTSLSAVDSIRMILIGS